jgi:hypothetical protein
VTSTAVWQESGKFVDLVSRQRVIVVFSSITLQL